MDKLGVANRSLYGILEEEVNHASIRSSDLRHKLPRVLSPKALICVSKKVGRRTQHV
jgi:hypothetical protein